MGRLLDHKRVDVALRALTELRKRGRDLRLLVVGEGPERERLMKLAAAAGVANFVTFVNFMPEREDVLRVLARAKVLLFPTVREGFGMVALEALALGTPVVTSDAADNFAQHLVTSGVNGEVCRAEPIFFADAVERVLGQLPRYSAAASDSVGAYDWDALAVAAGKVYAR